MGIFFYCVINGESAKIGWCVILLYRILLVISRKICYTSMIANIVRFGLGLDIYVYIIFF